LFGFLVASARHLQQRTKRPRHPPGASEGYVIRKGWHGQVMLLIFRAISTLSMVVPLYGAVIASACKPVLKSKAATVLTLCPHDNIGLDRPQAHADKEAERARASHLPEGKPARKMRHGPHLDSDL
jgi:hypothetical protein